MATADELDELLHSAIRVGDIDNVREALASGANPNAKDKDGILPLILAISKADKEIVHELLIRGANPNEEFPLHKMLRTIEYSDDKSKRKDAVAIINDLLNHGTDIEGLDGNGQRPLHIAVHMQEPEFTRELIARGAKVNAKDVFGETPLHNAYSSRANMEALRKNGAILTAKDDYGRTPADIATQQGYPEALEYLKQPTQVSLPSTTSTPVTKAKDAESKSGLDELPVSGHETTPPTAPVKPDEGLTGALANWLIPIVTFVAAAFTLGGLGFEGIGIGSLMGAAALAVAAGLGIQATTSTGLFTPPVTQSAMRIVPLENRDVARSSDLAITATQEPNKPSLHNLGSLQPNSPVSPLSVHKSSNTVPSIG